MQNHIPKIKALHQAIETSLFTTKPGLPYSKIVKAFDLLARLIDDYPGESEDWVYIGESGCCSLDSMIVAGYWHFSHWHAGQASPEYAALSSLGMIFSPGMSSEPRRNDNEFGCYKALDAMARREAGKPVYSFCPFSLST